MEKVTFNPHGKVTKRHQQALEDLLGIVIREYGNEYWFAGTPFKTRRELCEAMLDFATVMQYDVNSLTECMFSGGYRTLFVKNEQ